MEAAQIDSDSYDPLQYDLYRAGDPACVYHLTRWPLSEGRGRFGEFPLVVVREYFRGQGYAVLASEPRLPNAEGFILVSYPRKRRAADPAYQRMEAIFGSAALAELNASSDAAKVRWTGNAAGGDPDLFVFGANQPDDRFFVEVKHHDQLTTKQLVTFPLIDKLCPIFVARLIVDRYLPAGTPTRACSRPATKSSGGRLMPDR
jgi:hypothetical protein